MRTFHYVHLATKTVFKSAEIVVMTDRDLAVLRHVQRGMLTGQLQRDVAIEAGYAFSSGLRQHLQKLRQRMSVVTTVDLINKAVSLGLLRSGCVAAPIQEKTIYNSRRGTGRTNAGHPYRRLHWLQK